MDENGTYRGIIELLREFPSLSYVSFPIIIFARWVGPNIQGYLEVMLIQSYTLESCVESHVHHSFRHWWPSKSTNFTNSLTLSWVPSICSILAYPQLVTSWIRSEARRETNTPTMATREMMICLLGASKTWGYMNNEIISKLMRWTCHWP